MRILFVGGGSGGHFYPLIATAEAIKNTDEKSGTSSELYYMGPNPYNPEVLNQYGIKYIYCPAGKVRRYFSFLNFIDIFKTLAGVLVSLFKLFYIYPDVIMSKGGYTSVPVVLVAKWYRIPVVIHESDARPGRANILGAKIAKHVAVAHKSAAQFFTKNEVAHIGMPIRESFLKKISNPREVLGIPNQYPVIFITGGSLGAERLNDLVLDSLDELLPKYTIVHQTGEHKLEKVKNAASQLIRDPELQNRYLLFDTMTAEEISSALEIASVVVARAGNGTIAEIALKQKPAILVPIPEEISHDQRTNAYAYADTGAATVIEEKNISDGILESEIARILENPQTAATMSAAASNFTSADAAYKLATILKQTAVKHL